MSDARTDFINNRILPLVGKIQTNRGLLILRSSFMTTMPALMTGALLSLIQGLPLGQGYANFLRNSGISFFLQAGVNVCNLIALYFIASFGYHIGEYKKQNAFQCSLVALVCFLLITPLSASQFIDGSLVTVDGAISTGWLGAQGLFSAIIVGIAAINIYSRLLNKNLKIKMPEAVPESIAKPFEAIIPGLLTGLVFIAVRVIFSLTPWGNMHQCIYSLIQMPLVGIGNNFGAYLAVLILINILWLFGIHGTLLALSILMAVWNAARIENLNAYMAGLPLPWFVTSVFLMMFVQYIGGPGCLVGLAIDMPLFAKSQRYKALGKIACVPGIFNIIEPIIFGFPLVMNPIMAIPFILGPAIFMIISYILMLVGFLGIPVLDVSVMTTPFALAGWIVGAGWQWGIMMIVYAFLSCVIYLPFFKLCDRQALAEEQAAETRAA
ncbi:MAG: PTS transporter subunit EIIC [Treponema sp.]|jgi:PTS system cellobiose-specific IIC component|nr:PTS transporter subunit EIIC [Treponema sp.]